MVKRVSAISGQYRVGRLGGEATSGVTFKENLDLSLIQIAAWSDTLSAVGTKAAHIIGADTAPCPGRAVSTTNGSILRVEPLKWLIFDAPAFDLSSALSADEGTVLDLSHSRTHLSISGPQAALLLNRHLPLDLREASFPVGSVASTAFHHTGVTLWRSDRGYELLMIRGFALSLWQLLLETGAQFNAEIL